MMCDSNVSKMTEKYSVIIINIYVRANSIEGEQIEESNIGFATHKCSFQITAV